MNFAYCWRYLGLGALLAAVGASCTSTHDTADVVLAPPGAFQPDAGGKLIDENSACSALVQAESDARTALGCDQVERDCPSYIRPAGGADCFLYDQASLDGCTALYQSLTTCDEFDQRPCLLIAVSQCGGTGEGGAGGQASVGTGGESASGGETAIGGATSAGASN